MIGDQYLLLHDVVAQSTSLMIDGKYMHLTGWVLKNTRTHENVQVNATRTWHPEGRTELVVTRGISSYHAMRMDGGDTLESVGKVGGFPTHD